MAGTTIWPRLHEPLRRLADAGRAAGVAEKVVLLTPNDVAAVRAVLAGDHDIAAVILEPTGASFGQQPIGAEFVQGLRRLTEQHGVLLIFDEVVTGFRVSPGGAQAAFGVSPTCPASPRSWQAACRAAAVAGRKDILDRLDFAGRGHRAREGPAPRHLQRQPGVGRGRHRGTDCDRRDRCVRTRVTHRGVAACGIERGAGGGGRFLVGLWHLFGLPTFLNPRRDRPRVFDPAALTLDDLQTQSKPLVNRLRLALLVHGVDVNARIGGFLSATHTTDDVAHTADAFRQATRMLKQEGELPN